MSKIRINELARQLECKSREVIDILHSLGVTEALTHSSSIDEDMAEKTRRALVKSESAAEKPAAKAKVETPRAEPEPPVPPPQVAPPAPKEPEKKPVTEPVAEENRPRPLVLGAPSTTVEKAETPVDDRPRALPLRPPMLGRGAPIQPPVGPRATPPSGLPLRPVAPPVRPLPAGPTGTGPAAFGPRQPLRPLVTPPVPSGALPPHSHQAIPPVAPSVPPTAPPVAPPAATPAAPPSIPETSAAPPVVSSSAPARPAAPPARPGAPIAPSRPPVGQPIAPGQPRPPAAPSRPIAGQPLITRPAVGQPGPRPSVPPRPDVTARLGQPARPAFPGQAPMGPRPGAPMRPAGPRPGQPLYQGPARPGQPGPGRPMRPGGPGMRPGGPRPMHPTSRGVLLGPGVPPPPDAAATRRPAPNKRGPRQRGDRDGEEKMLRPQNRREQAAPPPINRDITISEGITVKELSEKLDVKANMVIKKLVDRGIFATMNQTLDGKLATEIAREFGASTSSVSYEEEAMMDIELNEEASDRDPRPPVVTIMGHVDHGKTSLLDAIRTANVAGKEAGGITQHIGAYHVEHKDKTIVFIDTPGHEAFTRMRARGAKVTDIVILVVAADDGVMPQTLEAIDHARAAKVPIIVAINKIDKPEAQPDRIKQQLADRGLNPEEWGGDTVMVPVSARQKTNLDLLLEMILLVSDMGNLRANAARPGMASVLEAKLDRGRGPVATILVRNGTVRVGDEFICGTVFGRVRAMLDDRGETVKEAGPSMPVEVLGLERLPEAGDNFQVVTDTAKAKQIVLFRAEKERAAQLAKSGRLTLEQLHSKMAAGEVHELPIILKADVSGSAEVLRDTLEKLSTEKVTVRVLRTGVGAINESDVLLAAASNAIVLGFNVRPERNATAAAEQEKVEIELHTIIYEVVDQIKKAMAGLLAPVYKEVFKGRAEVRETFKVSKIGTVAGSLVVEGSVTRDANCRILRDNVVVHTGKIGSLRRFKDDVSEVRNGTECGITIANFNDIHQGDVVEAYVMQRVAAEV